MKDEAEKRGMVRRTAREDEQNTKDEEDKGAKKDQRGITYR